MKRGDKFVDNDGHVIQLVFFRVNDVYYVCLIDCRDGHYFSDPIESGSLISGDGELRADVSLRAQAQIDAGNLIPYVRRRPQPE